jgi:AAA+ ATPase superfamily predicted ATPase
MIPFIGRKAELEELRRVLDKQNASMVVIKGRRRIGKSRLIAELCKDRKKITFSGIPPTQHMTAQEQRLEFGWQLAQQIHEPAFKDDDWNDLFLRLSNYTKDEKIVIVLDEISWIGSKDHLFLSKLKNHWDLHFSKNPNLTLIMCGSVSSWIEKNILSSTGFVGRLSLILTLKELSLLESNQFWDKTHTSAYEKFKVLSVTGGIPKYLEEIDKQQPAEQNIRDLCFKPSGFLFNEFEHIFTDLFSKKNVIYKDILHQIANGVLEQNRIMEKLGLSKSGIYTKYFEDLETAGFITRDYTWNMTTAKKSKLSHYRISDNYTRFYLKYIEPHIDQIKQGVYDLTSLMSLTGWSGIMGLQFENLVLNNRRLIMENLRLAPDDLLYDNPFFQPKTPSKKGCQIDYMIQSRFDTLYVCEIKFSKNPIGKDIIPEMEEKINALVMPKRLSIRPVLIHVNGATDEVIESKYFAHVIDFSKYLG